LDCKLLHFQCDCDNLFSMETETKRKIKGHIAASASILIWGTTFISTKVLLEDFTPIEILFYRFILAYLLLFVISPKPIRPRKDKKELLYAAAGLCGVSLYFLFQNIGLTYTLASNAGVIVAVAPMFTAIISYFLISQASLHRNFIIGFFITITGVALISFNGNFVLKLNPLGDILMILGALSWAFYCNLLVFIDEKELSIIQHTRKVFFYGLLLMIPVIPFTDFHLGLSRFADPANLTNLLFLAFGASAISFVTWNFAVGVLGSVKTATYIYFSPIVTVVASLIVLREPFTWISLCGTVLILFGLVISERKNRVQALCDNISAESTENIDENAGVPSEYIDTKSTDNAVESADGKSARN
jgi:drug/metabolite transporter (DMT)-like permease